jgi:hypothetical protein
MDEETGQLLELAEIGGALTSSGGQHNVRRGGEKEDWVISVASVSSLSVSFCTGAFSV